MTKSEIRDIVITGSYLINNGMKEPAHGWEDYANKLEDMLIKNNGVLRIVGKSLPIGDVEILIKGLEHIGKWGDEEEERWDDPGDCAMDTLTQYRYSMSIR